MARKIGDTYRCQDCGTVILTVKEPPKTPNSDIACCGKPMVKVA